MAPCFGDFGITKLVYLNVNLRFFEILRPDSTTGMNPYPKFFPQDGASVNAVAAWTPTR